MWLKAAKLCRKPVRSRTALRDAQKGHRPEGSDTSRGWFQSCPTGAWTQRTTL